MQTLIDHTNAINEAIKEFNLPNEWAAAVPDNVNNPREWIQQRILPAMQRAEASKLISNPEPVSSIQDLTPDELALINERRMKNYQTPEELEIIEQWEMLKARGASERQKTEFYAENKDVIARHLSRQR